MNFECGGKESRQIHDVEMELNEFQVQRAIEQKEDNEVV